MRFLKLVNMFFLFLVPALNACSDDGSVDGSAVKFAVASAFPNLAFDRPLDLQHPGDGTNRLFVVEQDGRILVFDNRPDVAGAKVFLDIRNQVNTAGTEEGLLGLAFHPQFATNRFYFVYYSVSNPRRTRLSRFEADPVRPDTTRSSSEQVLLEIDQPYSNHNGGQIAFGPDGLIYVGVGDGGAAGDPHGNGQNRSTLLGNILRLNVDTAPYGIPPDNPFVGNQEGFREEIYAYGLRNPWRFSFDPVTSWLWVADVGQNRREEIDVVEKGKNYGWNIMEGSICYPSPPCDASGLMLPVWEYSHPPTGGRSVTGGFVYRGRALPSLVGAYIYGDYLTGEIWALRYDGTGRPNNVRLLDSNLLISSFGIDASQELFICSFDGKIYRLETIDG